ncbi:hypothetical protein cypCar_00036899, partial [Cyprinus carpio]
MDAECIQEISRVLPELDNERLMGLIEHLTSAVGVTNKEDLAFIERDDFQDHLTPIQCRKVIQAFKQRDSCNKGIHRERHEPSSHTKTHNAWEHISLFHKVD